MIPNLSLDDGVVEIIGDNSAHYFAYVYDVFDPNDDNSKCGPSDKSSDEPLITLRFKNDWRKRDAFPLSRIRLLPKTNRPLNTGGGKQNGHSNDILNEGSEAEVWRAKNEGHECGFWKCVIKMAKDDFYGVSYISGDKTHCNIDGKEFHEIVTKERIRPINRNPYLKSNPFFKFVVEVPKDVFVLNPKLVKSADFHKNFRKALPLIAVNYDNRMHRLICVGFAENDKSLAQRKALKAAELLAPMHFRALKMEIEMRTQIDFFSQQIKNLDEIIQIKDNEFEILVRVEEQFMKYAIGQNGSNIKKVQQKPGVLAIDRVVGADDNVNVFRVVATDRNSLRVAKEMLQISEKVVNVTRDVVPHIIGKHGSLVQEMADKSGLIIIKVKGEDPNEKQKAYVPFHLIGTKDCIENADILLKFQINCVKENLEIDKKLSPKSDNKRRSH